MSRAHVSSGFRHAVVAARLRRIGRVRTLLDALLAKVEEELDAVHARYERRRTGLQSQLDGLHADLERYCRRQREALFPSERKTLMTPFGQVGFRRTGAAVKLLEGLGPEDVCRRLREQGLADLVRSKEAPDRRAVRRALAAERVSRPQLRRCGLRVVPGPERFQCRLRREAALSMQEDAR